MSPVDCKKLNVKTFEELNGIYFYSDYKHHKQGIVINVASTDFKSTNTDVGLINLFTNVDTHETIHQEIHKIVEKYAGFNTVEERFIELMAGQLRWNDGKNNT